MTIVTTAYAVSPEVTKRQKIERAIAGRAVTALLDAGYHIAVAMGDERPEKTTRSKKTIMAQLGECDEDRILVYKPDNLPPDNATGREHPANGWIFLVYGNSGWDVICDYTNNLEAVLQETNDYAESLS